MIVLDILILVVICCFCAVCGALIYAGSDWILKKIENKLTKTEENADS